MVVDYKYVLDTIYYFIQVPLLKLEHRNGKGILNTPIMIFRPELQMKMVPNHFITVTLYLNTDRHAHALSFQQPSQVLSVLSC